MNCSITNVSSLIGPYFKPTSWKNIPRVVALTSYIAISALQTKYMSSCSQHMYAAVDFFRAGTSSDIATFPDILNKALIHGLLPFATMICSSAWVHNKLIILLRNDLIKDLFNEWLSVLRKETPFSPLKNAETILADDCSTVVDETVASIEKAVNTVQIISSIAKVYSLTRSLYHPSLPFPLNYSKGFFAVILVSMVVITFIQIYIQKFLSEDRKKAMSTKQDLVKDLQWINFNRQQLVSLPETNRTTIINHLLVRAKKALDNASNVQMEFLLQGQTSFLFPISFELLLSRITYVFNSQIDTTQVFPPLFRESIQLLRKFTYFLQNMLNSSTSCEAAIANINSFRASLKPQNSHVTITNGNSLKCANVTLVVKSYDSKTSSLVEHQILRDFSIELSLGKTYIVKGDNGCGKSVFFQFIQRIYPGESGSLTRPEEVIYVTKTVSIRSIKQNFKSLLSSEFGITNDEVTKNIKEKLKEFNSLKDFSFEDNSLNDWSTLSAGQTQILNLIVALRIANQDVSKPCLLIGDEALSHLDSSQREQMLKEIKNWKDQNNEKRGVFIVEHTMPVDESKKVNQSGKTGFSVYESSL